MRFLRLVTTSIIIVAFAATAFTVTAYAATPSVDGFLGVPWGASRTQVEKVMGERGFTLLVQRSDVEVDIYQGTFADYPAELCFDYTKNALYKGSAAFLDVKGREPLIRQQRYIEMKNLIALKYGPPSQEYVGYKDIEFISNWENLSTTGSPPGRVSIEVRWIAVSYNAGILEGAGVSYSVGREWLKLKSAKDI